MPDVAAAEAVAKEEFEKDYAKYAELLARNTKPTVAGKAELQNAWQAICRRWNVPGAGRTPGALTWDDADGTVQVASAPTTPILPQQRLTVGQTWTNSLGMEFVPVPGTDVLFCKWETRVQDYAAFAKDTGLAWQPASGSNPSDPAVGMTWSDAQAFCKWLTEREIAAGGLSPGRMYRLPKDWEWSVAVGLKEDKKGTPAQRAGKIVDVYPWGNQWPPPVGAGNVGPGLRTDSFPRLSSVGSFPANQYGLFDMCGNVGEWCQDDADGNTGKQPNRVALRGGSWNCSGASSLLSSSRYLMGPDKPSAETGIRCVVTKPSR
jgi:formylglycine-generating enzyme required for sulfatase activity